ncbi:MarR family transcriptional regulator [Altererythrobacter indicus]|uniref:MarR family transcriptional regulator n=1 Tax=Altericroceibacterium indicum TaxID=374177 RepID=A0A845A905_9SPHN|nr:MarR family transcriptional regulator [Altericroceibacterium indicum]MXP26730.1 MarR family transcriptional regulator [Altericroceibacterium indicum]
MPKVESLVAEYVELYVKMMKMMDRRMTQCGASFARTRVLLVLFKFGEQRATEIAERFSQSPRTVTEAIDALERDGLVSRCPDPSDRRAKLIHITSKGIESLEKTEPMRQKFIAQTFGKLSDEEKSSFHHVIAKLNHAVDDMQNEG